MRKFFPLAALLMLVATVFSCSSSDDDGDEGSSSDVVLSTTEISVDAEGGTKSFAVKSSTTPTTTSNQSWCAVSLSSSTSNGTHTFSVEVSASTETSERAATITVKVGSSYSATVTVTQGAADSISLSATSFAVEAAGGDISIEVTANGDYDYEIGASWISASSTSSDVLVFTVAQNVSSGTRTGTITFTLGSASAVATITQSGTDASTITADAWDIAAQMYPGWNLGNTMESNGSGLSAETYWQSTKTTQTIIDFVASCGFKSIRIPCNWYSHFDSGTTTINSSWIARVKEVVDYCIIDGLYVVLNDHYDLGWLQDSFDDVSDSNVSAKSDTLKAIWTQVAEYFVDYDEHLLFAGLNEPDAATSAKTTALIKYEQVFVDAVRATGGNNALRTLVVQGPATDIDNTYSLYTAMPTDSAEDRLMMEVHYYTPWNFCGLEEDASWGVMQYYFSSDNHVSGSNRNVSSSYEESYIQSQFAKMKEKFCEAGYPVLLGEYGCQWRDVSSDGDQDKHNASVKAFHKAVNQYAISNGLIPFVWDINYCSQPTMTVLKRSNCSVYCSYAMEGITEGISAGSWPY